MDKTKIKKKIDKNKGRTKCEIFSRVVGYLTATSKYNEGKLEEFHDRKLFKINI